MKLLKTAVLGGMLLSTSALVIGGTFVILTNKNKIISKLKNLQFKENKSASIK